MSVTDLAPDWVAALNDSCLVSHDDGLNPVAQPELAKDPTYMGLDRGFSEKKALCDFRVRKPATDQS
jgi:hypothetical protein